MSLILVRANSDTPNIQNYDDARMMRFAVGGINGVLKGYKEECKVNTENNILTILPGEVVVDGWQVSISGSGEQVILDTVAGKLYHKIYLQVNLGVLTAQDAEIIDKFSQVDQSYDMPNDDLSDVPTGSKAILLFSVITENGSITGVTYEYNLIEYADTRIKEEVATLNNKIKAVGSTKETRVNFADQANKSTFSTNADRATSTDFTHSGFTQIVSGSKITPPKDGAHYEFYIAERFGSKGTEYYSYSNSNPLFIKIEPKIPASGYGEVLNYVQYTFNDLGVQVVLNISRQDGKVTFKYSTAGMSISDFRLIVTYKIIR